jgi:hypothetical protein
VGSCALGRHQSREPAALARLRKGYAGRLEQADDLTELLIRDEVTLRTLVR